MMLLCFQKITSNLFFLMTTKARCSFSFEFLQRCLLAQELQDLLHTYHLKGVKNSSHIFLALTLFFNQFQGNIKKIIKITSLKLLKSLGLPNVKCATQLNITLDLV